MEDQMQFSELPLLDGSMSQVGGSFNLVSLLFTTVGINSKKGGVSADRPGIR